MSNDHETDCGHDYGKPSGSLAAKEGTAVPPQAPVQPLAPSVPWTAGPWSLPHFAEPDTGCSCGYVLTDGFCGAVATVHCSGEGYWLDTGDNPKFAEAVANARLIAAAPDLAEACAGLVRAWRDAMGRIGCEELDAAEAALRKATTGNADGCGPEGREP